MHFAKNLFLSCTLAPAKIDCIQFKFHAESHLNKIII